MKYVAIGLVVVLTGCAQIKMMLVKHDPALANLYVETSIQLQYAKCDNKPSLRGAFNASERMARYAEFREDPQAESAKAVETNITKASTASEAACQRWLNLANQRMEVLNKAWSGR